LANDLLSALNENLGQMKCALNKRIEYKIELISRQNGSEEELEQVELEILTLFETVIQSEAAILSVSNMKSTDEFGVA
jgi:hypothetical protein